MQLKLNLFASLVLLSWVEATPLVNYDQLAAKTTHRLIHNFEMFLHNRTQELVGRFSAGAPKEKSQEAKTNLTSQMNSIQSSLLTKLEAIANIQIPAAVQDLKDQGKTEFSQSDYNTVGNKVAEMFAPVMQQDLVQWTRIKIAPFLDSLRRMPGNFVDSVLAPMNDRPYPFALGKRDLIGNVFGIVMLVFAGGAYVADKLVKGLGAVLVLCLMAESLVQNLIGDLIDKLTHRI